MRNRAWLLWAVGAWVTPALVAGALGWKGVWGATSALGDYLVPVPVAGGVLHVPSFAAAVLAVRLWPYLPPRLVSLARGACLGAALVGLAMLVDLEDVFLAVTTDVPWRGVPWEKNALGLFWLTDSLWLLAPALARPSLRTLALPALAVALALPCAYAVFRIRTGEKLSRPFVMGRRGATPNRWESIQYVYTRLRPGAPGFRAAVLQFVEEYGLTPGVNSEEVAIHFTDSLGTARGAGKEAVLTTLCLYEDGTPERWEPGEGDCFGGHVSFGERLAELASRFPRSIPSDVRDHLLRRDLCAGFEPPDRPEPGLARSRYCHRFDPDASLEALQARYEREALDVWGVAAKDPAP